MTAIPGATRPPLCGTDRSMKSVHHDLGVWQRRRHGPNVVPPTGRYRPAAPWLSRGLGRVRKSLRRGLQPIWRHRQRVEVPAGRPVPKSPPHSDKIYG